MFMSRTVTLVGSRKHEYVLNHFVNRVPIANLRVWLYEILGVRFVDRHSSIIMLGAHIAQPRSLRVGRNTIIGPGCWLDARGGLTFGENVNISGGAIFQTGKHYVDSPSFEAAFEPIVIEDRAWVAQNGFVLGGVTVGEGAIVAAGAVVSKDVAPYTVVGGSPAQWLRDRSRDLTYQLDYRSNWI